MNAVAYKFGPLAVRVGLLCSDLSRTVLRNRLDVDAASLAELEILQMRLERLAEKIDGMPRGRQRLDCEVQVVAHCPVCGFTADGQQGEPHA